MTKIFIDGREGEFDMRRTFSISMRAAQITSLQGQSRELRISIPATRRNRLAVGDVDQVRSAEKFNSADHYAKVEAQGCMIFMGKIFLDSVERTRTGERWYNMTIRETQPGWVREAADNMLAELPVDFNKAVSGSAIRDSWSWEEPVRFFPVQRENVMVKNSGSDVIAPTRVLTPEDYHPFLHVGTIVKTIIEQAGYKLRSDFAETPLFSSLYMSGNYTEQNTALLRSRMDFRAGRTTEVSAPADRYGKVKANPLTSISSVGNIVETADYTLCNGAFNTNNAFRIIGGRIAFVPQSEARVGFEYYLNYKTPYKILSRTELSGFNSISLDDNLAQTFKIVNNFRGHRENVTPGMNYRLVVFGFVATGSYQLRYDKVLPGGGVQNVTYATFSSRTYSVSFPSENEVRNAALWVKAAGSATYSLSAEDWELYEGWVTETGTAEVEITLKSAPEKVTPSSPKYFDNVYFGGAAEGDLLTLRKGCCLRPVFSANPAAGSPVRFADVAAHGVRQIKVLEAVGHMFNLRFRTDEYTKEVFIEPYGEFFAAGDRVDWSGRGECPQYAAISEPGDDMNSKVTFKYMDGDDAVKKWESENHTVFGQWSAAIGNKRAAAQEKTVANPLFAPSLGLAGAYPDAPGAVLLQVGERDGYYTDSLNFPAKIVKYHGMKELPAGQLWGWPSYTGYYPLIGFHLPDADSLCFEDRDGTQGLHRFYDGEFEQTEKGRRITLEMNLSPADIEAIFISGAFKRDFRGGFLIKVDDETIPCRLEAVEGFDPIKGGACMCTFITA